MPTTHSPPPRPSSSGINNTDTQALREGTARTAKNKDKADMARILRCAAEALKRLKAASKKRRDAKVTRALVEKKIVPKTPVEKDIVHKALTKTLTKKESRRMHRLRRLGPRWGPVKPRD